MRTHLFASLSTTAIIAAASTVQASITDFNESFLTGTSNWRGASSTTLLNWSSAGGPSDGSYVSSLLNLSSTSAGGYPATVFRASTSLGSSGGGFAGNWIDAGATNLTFDFRHDLSEALTITLRVATPQNYPGAAAFASVTVAPNVWSTVSFDLSAASAQWVSFEGSNYATVLSNVGAMQLGFVVPTALAGQNIDGHFDMTNFSITPAPGACALLAVAGMASRRRRSC